ncbi:MAG TPA: DUF4833 domain-containing protein [Flavobacteriales bacterium]|jgi:hypothetical protein|nr:DUF4833 domain-containing protein [Flavobacteriales bacterium]
MIVGRAFVAAFAFAALVLPASAQPDGAVDEAAVFEAFPVPEQSKSLLFYIQRNKNANAIVYEARFGADGKLVEKDPVRVQWIRYTEGGKRGDLSMLEASIAYGVKHKGNMEDYARMAFVASNKYPFNVVVDANGQAQARMMIDGHYARLQHIRIQAEESSFWPKIKYVDIFGVDVITGQVVQERYIP